MPAKKRQPAPVIAFTSELIAKRAYLKWQARGCPVTDGLEDWFAAQSELERERAKPAQRMKSALD